LAKKVPVGAALGHVVARGCGRHDPAEVRRGFEQRLADHPQHGGLERVLALARIQRLRLVVEAHP